MHTIAPRFVSGFLVGTLILAACRPAIDAGVAYRAPIDLSTSFDTAPMFSAAAGLRIPVYLREESASSWRREAVHLVNVEDLESTLHVHVDSGATIVRTARSLFAASFEGVDAAALELRGAQVHLLRFRAIDGGTLEGEWKLTRSTPLLTATLGVLYDAGPTAGRPLGEWFLSFAGSVAHVGGRNLDEVTVVFRDARGNAALASTVLHTRASVLRGYEDGALRLIDFGDSGGARSGPPEVRVLAVSPFSGLGDHRYESVTVVEGDSGALIAAVSMSRRAGGHVGPSHYQSWLGYASFRDEVAITPVRILPRASGHGWHDDSRIYVEWTYSRDVSVFAIDHGQGESRFGITLPLQTFVEAAAGTSREIGRPTNGR